VVLVFAAPGPWVISDSESKAESAAKTMPLFSAVVQTFQDDRDKAASAGLRWGRTRLPKHREGRRREFCLSRSLRLKKATGS